SAPDQGEAGQAFNPALPSRKSGSAEILLAEVAHIDTGGFERPEQRRQALAQPVAAILAGFAGHHEHAHGYRKSVSPAMSHQRPRSSSADGPGLQTLAGTTRSIGVTAGEVAASRSAWLAVSQAVTRFAPLRHARRRAAAISAGKLRRGPMRSVNSTWRWSNERNTTSPRSAPVSSLRTSRHS